MKFDIVLTERPHTDGLTKIEISELLEKIEYGSVIPIEIVGDYSSAMGFISLDCADSLDYDYEKMSEYIKSILNDMENESNDCTYRYDVYTIWLSR